MRSTVYPADSVIVAGNRSIIRCVSYVLSVTATTSAPYDYNVIYCRIGTIGAACPADIVIFSVAIDLNVS
jgi:hypothetical protein